MAAARVDRRFLRIAQGQIHYREAGAGQGGVPLLMAHAGPGASGTLVNLLADLGADRHAIAPDMMGNGDSDPPPMATPDMAFYVECLVGLMDALHIPQADFFGQHTGAHIGCELALRHPQRVRRLILDGVALFPAELKAQMVARYAPPIVPDEHGGHLLQAWQFVRELTVHFPHFLKDPAHRLLASPVPPPAISQALLVEVMKALPTYHLAYQAAFRHEAEKRLPLLAVPTLVMCAENDPLLPYLDAAAALVPAARKAQVAATGRAAAVRAFLAS